ncbi:MAG: serine/threonine protein phosphatase [Spirochaetes bacterium]|nr:serine/threonine protein phosphatase [Spirochaetota bacterium]
MSLTLLSQLIKSFNDGTSFEFIDKNKEELCNIISSVKTMYLSCPKWIKLPGDKDLLCIGDLHGDFNSLLKIFSTLFKNQEVNKNLIVIFLGDYVDRGEYSLQTILGVILFKHIYGSSVHMLAGNHEIYKYFQYYNADFWEKYIDENIRENILELIEYLPMLISSSNIMMVHGGLPIIDSMDFLNNLLRTDKTNNLLYLIENYEEQIRIFTWGDYCENLSDYNRSIFQGRPAFMKNYFADAMKTYDSSILVRGHQPGVKGVLFDNSLITLLTSSIYSSFGNIPGKLTLLIKRDKEKRYNFERKIVYKFEDHESQYEILDIDYF